MLAVRRSKTDARRPGYWDLPGGVVDSDETFTEGLIREVKEEVGMALTPDHVELVWAKADANDERSVVVLFYVACVHRTEVTLSPEHDKAQWVWLEDAIDDFDFELQKEGLKYIDKHDLKPRR